MAASEGVSSGTKPSRGGKKVQQQRQHSPVPRKNSSTSDKDEDDPVLQSIASKPSVLHQPQVTLTCYIPSQSIGAVIGRRGSTIAQIQRHAQQYGIVRVSIVGHDDTSESVPYTFSELDWSSSELVPVIIRGYPAAALCAAQRLREVAGGLDDVILDIPLNRSKFSSLIGKRGMNLANLSADTNVRIMVPQRTLRIDLIQLEGELDNVKVCFEKVVVLLSSMKRKNGNSASGEEKVSASIEVPALPSQTKLRVVAKKTETSLQKKRQADDTWLITVWGQDAEHCQSAVAMLESWKNQKAGQGSTPTNRRTRTQNRKPKSGKKGKGGGPPTTAAASSSPPAAAATSPEATPKETDAA